VAEVAKEKAKARRERNAQKAEDAAKAWGDLNRRSGH
jgi:hypothetical protein